MKILGINHAKIYTNSITEIQDDSDCYLRGLMLGAAMFPSVLALPLHHHYILHSKISAERVNTANSV